MRILDKVKVVGAVLFLLSLLFLHSYGMKVIKAHLENVDVEATE